MVVGRASPGDDPSLPLAFGNASLIGLTIEQVFMPDAEQLPRP
jgi:hypothetical protein